MNVFNFSWISTKKISLILPFLLIIHSCSPSSSKPEILIGKGLDDKNHEIKKQINTFKPAEPFSVVLKNVKFTDINLKISIYSIDKSGKTNKSRSQIVKIDKKYNYLQINQAMSIPFPGQYILEFSQHDKPIAKTFFTIKK